MSVEFLRAFAAPVEVPVLIIGAGAAGLTAALSARSAGAGVLVLERDAEPSGSTALSSGLIPAAGTRFQRALGIEDSPALFAADILAKNHDRADPEIVRRIAEASAEAVEFLEDVAAIRLSVVEGFRYPGHSALRMHGTPERTGGALMARLLDAAAREGIDIATKARATGIIATAEGRILGVEIARPGDAAERVACQALVLACNGYGGNPGLIRTHIPALADALYFGHAGNTGDALRWGEALGARAADLSGHQGHGSVATPHGILITWATMMEGGVQVNADGVRFSNEHRGYSEQAEAVLAQPGGIAVNVYDRRIHEIALQFEDYRNAVALGAVRQAADAAQLAATFGLPAERLAKTLGEVAALAVSGCTDRLGRRFDSEKRLEPPFFAVRVTGALFHTQGGLEVDRSARVLRSDGTPFPNLFAAGGAARGVSGPAAEGYLAGNGLLAAVVLGRFAGQGAAAQARNVRTA